MEEGLGFPARPRGLCSARGQVERGPRRAVVRRAAAIAFRRGATVTRTGVGPTCQREERGERAAVLLGCAGGCCALRAARS